MTTVKHMDRKLTEVRDGMVISDRKRQDTSSDVKYNLGMMSKPMIQ